MPVTIEFSVIRCTRAASLDESSCPLFSAPLLCLLISLIFSRMETSGFGRDVSDISGVMLPVRQLCDIHYGPWDSGEVTGWRGSILNSYGTDSAMSGEQLELIPRTEVLHKTGEWEVDVI